jgi:hypothetical protein
MIMKIHEHARVLTRVASWKETRPFLKQNRCTRKRDGYDEQG